MSSYPGFVDPGPASALSMRPGFSFFRLPFGSPLPPETAGSCDLSLHLLRLCLHFPKFRLQRLEPFNKPGEVIHVAQLPLVRRPALDPLHQSGGFKLCNVALDLAGAETQPLAQGLFARKRLALLLPPVISQLQQRRQMRRAQSQSLLCPQQEGGDDGKAQLHHLLAPFFLGRLRGLLCWKLYDLGRFDRFGVHVVLLVDPMARQCNDMRKFMEIQRLALVVSDSCLESPMSRSSGRW